MSNEITKDEALRKLVARCATKEHCVWDVREKLRHWNIGREDEDYIIKELIADGYINEVRYCRAYVHDQFNIAGWGRVKIGYTLRQKQIDALTISQALQTIDEEEYLEKLTRLLRGKGRGLKTMLVKDQMEKLTRFALSRGFEPHIITKALRDLSLSCDHPYLI